MSENMLYVVIIEYYAPYENIRTNKELVYDVVGVANDEDEAKEMGAQALEEEAEDDGWKIPEKLEWATEQESIRVCSFPKHGVTARIFPVEGRE